MNISYASNHRWLRHISENDILDYGSNNAKKLKQLLDIVDSLHISYTFEPLQEYFFDWFKPLYETSVATKENFHGHDIYQKTLGNNESKYPYYSLTVYENNIAIGGAIFTLREDRLSIVYRTFQSKWLTHEKIRCTPALYGEHLLTQQAKKHGFSQLVHGSDRNPYGLNSNIGLAIFKLSVGCRPELQKTYTIHQLETTDCNKNVLVMHLPKKGKIITEATLVCKKDELEKYAQLFKYENRLHIHHTTI